MSEVNKTSTADYNDVSSDYLEKRQLKRRGGLDPVSQSWSFLGYIRRFTGWNFGLAQGGFGGMLIVSISYALMILSHIILRVKERELERPYRTLGGIVTTGTAFVLAPVAFVSTFLLSLEAALWSGVFYAILVAYFTLYSRHHIVAKAPKEEFAAIAEA